MEFFRYRRVALSCVVFLISLFISYYLNSIIKIATLALAGVAFAVFTVIYLKSKSERMLNIIICTALPLLLVILSMAVSLISFDKNELHRYLNQREHTIEATVIHHRLYRLLHN